MLRVMCFVVIIVASSVAYAGDQFVTNNDNRFTIDAYDLSGGGSDSTLDTTTEARNIFLAIDGGATVPGTVSANSQTYNITSYTVGTSAPAAPVNYGGGGIFGGSTAFTTIHPSLTGDDYGVRARTFIEFAAGGTYTIGSAGDDGRRISLTAKDLVAGSPFVGFTASGSSNANNADADLSPFVLLANNPTDVQDNRGVFQVSAGDILELDVTFFERGGGEEFEIAIASGNQVGLNINGNTPPYVLLADGALNGAIQLSSQVALVPEPTGIAAWSVIGMGLVGFLYYRFRGTKK